MTLSCVVWGCAVGDGGGGWGGVRFWCSPPGWHHPQQRDPALSCRIKAGEGLMEGWEVDTETSDGTLAAVSPVY